MVTTDTNPNLVSTVEIEALDRTRRRMLVAVVISSVLMLLPHILQGIEEGLLPRMVSNVLVLVGAAGALAFVYFMMQYHRFQTRIHRDPELCRRLNDERIREMRMKAICRAWITLVVAVAIGVAAAPFADLPDQAVLMTLMLLSVNMPIVFFLILDRD